MDGLSDNDNSMFLSLALSQSHPKKKDAHRGRQWVNKPGLQRSVIEQKPY